MEAELKIKINEEEVEVDIQGTIKTDIFVNVLLKTCVRITKLDPDMPEDLRECYLHLLKLVNEKYEEGVQELNMRFSNKYE